MAGGETKLQHPLGEEGWSTLRRGLYDYSITAEGMVYMREPRSGEGAVGRSIRQALEKLEARLSNG